MSRLFIFESHPVQYHAPVYRVLHQICHETGHGDVRVVYATDTSLRGHWDTGFERRVAWDEPLLEGYPATVLQNTRAERSNAFRSLHGHGIFSMLKCDHPDAILLTGLRYEFDWCAYGSALRLRIPIWLRTETQDQAFWRSWTKSLIRACAYRLAYYPIERVMVIGRLNAAHYLRHGVSQSRHIPSAYCVVDRFGELSACQREEMRNTLRRKLGFAEGTTVLLFCGKLQPKKNPGLLLDAMAALPAERRRKYAILFVGAGELEIPLRTWASELTDLRVVFVGFKNQTELPPYYLASDVLVLPSRQMGETWGLVANEALLAERRVIISKHVGCHADFQGLPSVRVFDGTRADFLDVLRDLPPPGSSAGQREFMKRYSIRAAAEGIAQAMGILGANHQRAANALNEVSQSFSAVSI